MKIPDKIKIGGHWITVEIVGDKELPDDLGSYTGWCKVIKINRTAPKTTQIETFLHEIFEAIGKAYEVKIKHQDLTILSTALFQIIRDNKLDFRDNKSVT